MWYVVVGIVLISTAAAATVPLRRWLKRNELQRALREFKLRRELLEAKFFDLAAASGKPRDLRWLQCDWQPAVAFARDLETKLLTAFVSVEVHFEAIEGGDMEDVDAVRDIRNASAVFHCRRGVWGTGGKVLFNMSPEEAVRRLAGQFEPVELPGICHPPSRQAGGRI